MKRVLITIVILVSLCFTSFADEKDDLIEQLQLQNAELVSALADTTKTLEKTTTALAESTILIQELEDRIESDQEEISGLREAILDQATRGYKYFSFGFGISYPFGAKIIATFRIPKLPLGFFVDFGGIESKDDDEIIDLYFSGGITFSF